MDKLTAEVRKVQTAATIDQLEALVKYWYNASSLGRQGKRSRW